MNRPYFGIPEPPIDPPYYEEGPELDCDDDDGLTFEEWQKLYYPQDEA